MSDINILTGSMIILSLVKSLLVNWTAQYLLKRKSMKMRHLEIIKFKMSLWKGTYYTSIVIYALYTLRNTEWLLDPSQYARKCTFLSLKFKIYYLVSLSYYFNEFITIFTEPRKKDFIQMLAHHIATITLIILSYTKGLTRYGLAILILHDIADPWLEIAKVNLTLKNSKTADVCFFIFMMTFIILRIGIYPYFIVFPATKYLIAFKLQFWNIAIAAMLNALVIIHIIWAYYIFKVFIKVIKKNDVTDARSEEEDLSK